MKAVTWQGRQDMRVIAVPDAVVEQPTDVVVDITSTGLCGSDLHLYDPLSLFMTPGDIVGHDLAALLSAIDAVRRGGTLSISGALPLADAPEAYRSFRDKEDGMVKVVFTP